MNPRIDKLKAERDKLAQRRGSLDVRIQKLDDQILNLENTDIIGIVRENGLSLDRLAELMGLLEKSPTATIPEDCNETEERALDEE